VKRSSNRLPSASRLILVELIRVVGS
jgi:hypothetical protein